MKSKVISSRKAERIVKSGLDKSVITKKGKANTFSGFLIASMKRARDDGNIETAMFLQEIYNKFKEFHPKKSNTIEIIDGWKGQGNLQINKDFNEDFVIIEHIKDKDGEIKKVQKTISKNKVNFIKNIIKDFKKDEIHSCYEFAKPLGFNSWKDLWRERKTYFSDYYYPIKILEALGLIKYGGRGQIIRI